MNIEFGLYTPAHTCRWLSSDDRLLRFWFESCQLRRTLHESPMPTLEWNKQTWDGGYDWQRLRGDNWSEPWGTAEAQWYGSIYPRLYNLLSARTLLEIAPGAGRWTQFLLRHCERLIGVDYSAECVAVCRERFASETKATFHVNDGKSLAMIADGSIDFVFSFDSLVHVEVDVIESYLGELARKLTPDGIGFVHHSNLGEYPRLAPLEEFCNRRMLWRLRHAALAHGLWPTTHSRGQSVSARLFAQLCDKAGLRCVAQEVINWNNRGVGARFLIDCLSTFTPAGSRWERPLRIVRNPYFTTEARSIQTQSSLYSFAPLES